MPLPDVPLPPAAPPPKLLELRDNVAAHLDVIASETAAVASGNKEVIAQLDADVRKRVGDRVRDLRTEQGMTQMTLADESALHITYVNRIERGLVSLSIPVLVRLARPLGVSASAIIDGIDGPDHRSVIVASCSK